MAGRQPLQNACTGRILPARSKPCDQSEVKVKPCFVLIDDLGVLPLLRLGRAHALDGLGGIDGGFAAVAVEEELAVGRLKEALLVTGRIAELAAGLFHKEFGVFGIIFNLADDFLHNGFPFLVFPTFSG